MSNKMVIVTVLLLAILVTGCGGATSTTTDSDGAPQIVPTSTDNNAKVKVMADGSVFLNGVEATIDDLKQEFERLSTVDGSVCYSREAADGEPHPIVEQVLNAVIESGLPITLSDTDCV
jgi:hypothetical protein